jgi:hypothetical protein
MHPTSTTLRAPLLALTLAILAACGGSTPPDTTPWLSGSSPAEGQVGVPTLAPIVFDFARAITPATVTTSSLVVSTAAGQAVSGRVSATATQATFTPDVPLAGYTAHIATITPAVLDASGGPLPSLSIHFTTGAPVDRAPPSITGRVPASDATNVATSQIVTATFDRQLKASTVTTATASLRTGDAAGAALPALVSVDATGTKISIAPLSPLSPSQLYTAVLTTGITSSAGIALSAQQAWSFTTAAPADSVPPVVLQIAPADLSSGLSTTARIEVVFSEAVQLASLTSTNLKLKLGSSPVSASISLVGGRIAQLKPDAALQPGKTYSVSVGTGVKDLAGNALAKAVDTAFTTGGGADTAGPTVADQSPSDGETGVATNRPVVVVFSEPVAPSTVDATRFKVTAAGGAVIDGAFLFDGAALAFVPSAPLPAGVQIAVVLDAGLADLSGNTLGAAKTYSFTTGAGPDTMPPTVTATSPAANAAAAPVRSGLQATFSEFVLPSSVNGSTFLLLDPTGAAVPGTITVSGNGASLQPLSQLLYGQPYTGKLTTGITDAAGNHLAADVTFPFTVQPIPPVKVDEVAPKVASGAAGDTNGDELTDSTQDEFIELLNTDATSTADLSGWVLRTGSATTTLHDQFTFPEGTLLAPLHRAVVFGGGAPAGDFGGALVFVTKSLSLTDSGGWVALHAGPGSEAEAPFAYPAAPSSGASLTRTPPGTGAFGDHAAAAGSATVLWSPGTAPVDARFKVNKTRSAPAPATAAWDGKQPATVQFNLGVYAQSLAGNLKVYASDCATKSAEVTTGSWAVGTGGTTAVYTPGTGAPLKAGSLHCLAALPGLRSDARVSGGAAAGATLGAEVHWEFTTATVSFDVASAAMTGATALSVVFSAPPATVSAQTAANYCVAASGATTCPSPALSAVTAAALTGSTVKLTLATALTVGASYTLLASNVTRASDSAALTTKSAPFTGWTQPPFTFAAAASTGESEVTATFSQPPAAGFAAANFCIEAAAATSCATSALAITSVTASSTNPASLVLVTAPQAKAQAYKLFATGLTRADDGAALQPGAQAFKGSLLSNGSFEKDQQPASGPATAPPVGWTMVTSSASGNLLHAVQADGTNGVPPAAHGLDVARFDSLTSSISGREAQSDCFPIDPSKSVAARAQVRIPSGQLPAGTKASLKLWYFKDATCTTKSAVRDSDTQTGASNSASGVWEARSYQPASNPPSDAVMGKLSVRAQYVSGQSCGTGGANCSGDVLYFDDLAVTQP